MDLQMQSPNSGRRLSTQAGVLSLPHAYVAAVGPGLNQMPPVLLKWSDVFATLHSANMVSNCNKWRNNKKTWNTKCSRFFLYLFLMVGDLGLEPRTTRV